MKWHPEALAEQEAIAAAGERAALRRAVRKLRTLGPGLGSPHTSALRGRAARGLRELRPRAGSSPWRAFYRQLGQRTFVILAVGPEALHDQRGFQAAVQRAARRFASLPPASDRR